MPRKKETRYGAYQYYRVKLKDPETGKYVPVYGKTQAERDAKAAQLRAEWAARAETASSPYVWEYAARWFAINSPGMTESRRDQVSREINKHICPIIGQIRLKDLTSDDCKAVMAARAGMARATQEKTRQVLRRILGDAEEAGYIQKDPTRRLKAAGRPAAKIDALTPAQEKTLLEAVRGLSVEMFVLLALYAGLRREEICGLKWDCVDTEGKAPNIRVRRVCHWIRNSAPEISPVLKSSAAWRTIPIPDVLADALRSARPEAPGERFVLENSQGGVWSYATLRSAWDSVEARSTGTVMRRRKDPVTGELTTVEIVKRLGDPVRNHAAVISVDFDVSPHVLRHTYITRLILGGVDLKRVQYLAGHSSAKITLDIYTSLMGHQPEDLIGDIAEIFNPDLSPAGGI